MRLFLGNLSRKLKINLNLTRILGTLHDDQYKFMDISRSVLLGMRTFSDKCVAKIKTQFYVQ